jgi:hypothetical protein
VPDPGERNAFLASVRSRLDLPDAIARDVLEELAGHLEDAAAELRAAGLSADDAERRAIGRLGDARALGTELARARRGRRQLLAAVGGGIRAVLAEGIRTWIFLAVLASLTAILALPAASIFAHVLGRSTSSYFGGPIGSLATVGAVVGGFAYLGWVLPARIAGPAVRSVFGVRRGVALIGLALGSAVLWFLVSVAMDPVLAVGLPLGPVAFALAALRAPERPTFRVGFVPAVIGAAVLFLPMTLLALATATDAHSDNWMADTSPIGDAPAATDVENTALGISWSGPDGRGWAEVTVDAGNAAATVATRLPTLRVEVWSARVVDGAVHFGSAPLVAQGTATEPITALDYSVPRLRDPLTTMAFVVGIAPDGRRVVLGENLELVRTPPWTGTLAEWWTGR